MSSRGDGLNISSRWFWLRYDARRFIRVGLWQSIAHKLPRRLAYFCYVRVMSSAWADAKTKSPEELTYSEVCKHWGDLG